MLWVALSLYLIGCYMAWLVFGFASTVTNDYTLMKDDAASRVALAIVIMTWPLIMVAHAVIGFVGGKW